MSEENGGPHVFHNKDGMDSPLSPQNASPNDYNLVSQQHQQQSQQNSALIQPQHRQTDPDSPEKGTISVISAKSNPSLGEPQRQLQSLITSPTTSPYPSANCSATENWEQFFKEAGIEPEWAAQYDKSFKENSMNFQDVVDLESNIFKEMGINKIGHILKIKRRVKQIQTTSESSNSLMHLESVDESANIKKPKLMSPEEKIPNRFIHIIEKFYFFDKSLIVNQVIKQVFLDRCRLSEWDTPIPAPVQFHNYSEISPADPVYLVGPRRFGKTTILHMLWAFFNGHVPSDKLKLLKISQDEEAMSWYGQFCVLYITFGNSSGAIHSENDCINACRNILHEAFKDYSYLLSFLERNDAKLFEKWTSHEDSKKLDKEDICAGLKFLTACLLRRHNYKKRCLILIDEYDRLSAKALFEVNGRTLDQIVSFYSDMVGQAVKHSSMCFGIFTGVTAITCTDQSSLNNMEIIHVLNDIVFFPFYGVTTNEFNDLLSGSDVDPKIKNAKDLAILYYNGYNLENVSILNVYSVRKFIKTGIVAEYWKESGISAGLYQAIRCKSWRKTLVRLMNWGKFNIEYKKSIRAEALDHISDATFEMIDFSIIWNLLLQQGYLNVIEASPEVSMEVSPEVSKETKTYVTVQIPNVEAQLELYCRLQECFQKKFTFDQEKIDVCRNMFLKIDISKSNDCELKLKTIKSKVNDMLNLYKKNNINEAWFESFLFHVFIENFHINPQKKIKETAKKNDIRTANILDLFVQTSDKCFVFEESLQDSAEKTLRKLLDKEYYIPAQKSGLPFLLIAFSVGEDGRGNAVVDICYLRNTIEGEFEVV